MNKSFIRRDNMEIEYEKNGNGTTLELRNDADWMVYGTDEKLDLDEIAEEQLDDVKKYLNDEPNADNYYDRYDREFLKDVVDALNEIIEEEK